MASFPAVFALRSNIAGRAYRFLPFAPLVLVLFLVRHSQAGQEPLRLPCARKSLLKRRLPRFRSRPFRATCGFACQGLYQKCPAILSASLR